MARHKTGFDINTIGFDYPVFNVADCQLELAGADKLADEIIKNAAGSNSSKVRSLGIKAAVNGAKLKLPDGRSLPVNKTFVNTMCRATKSAPSVFNLFRPDEVFNRFSQRLKNSNMPTSYRFAIEQRKNPDGTVKSELVRSMRPSDRFSPDMDMIRDFVSGIPDATGVVYSEGKIDFSVPNRRSSPIKVVDGDSDWTQRTFFSLPVDGFGRGCTYVELMRLICTNGLIGYSTAFRSEINIGETDSKKLDKRQAAQYALESFLDAMNNEEECGAMATRLRSAANSHMSLREYLLAWNVLAGSLGYRHLQGPMELGAMKRSESQIAADKLENFRNNYALLRKFDNMAHTGSPDAEHGHDGKLWRTMLTESQLSAKRASMIPTNVRVYDAINLLTEGVTHQIDAEHQQDRRRVHAFVGELLSKSFDCENSVTTMGGVNMQALYNASNQASVDARTPVVVG